MSLAFDDLETLFLPPTVETVEDLSQYRLKIYCFSPRVNRLKSMMGCIDNPEDVNHLYVLPKYLEVYLVQRQTEGIRENELIIEVIPKELRHYYDRFTLHE